MKLHSPRFERKLRHGVKSAIRSSAALKREYRAARKFRRRYNGYGLGRVFLWVLVAAAEANILRRTEHPAAALGALSLLAFLVALGQANNLFAFLFSSADLTTLILLPVTEDVIFRWELQKFFRRALFFLGDVLVAMGTLALMREFNLWQWCGMAVLAVLTWLTSVALGALFAARIPRARYVRFTRALAPVVMLTGMLGVFVLKGTMIDICDRAAPFLNYLLPTGWAVALFQLLLPHPDWTLLIFLIPVAMIISTVPNSLRRLRSFYRLREVADPQAGDVERELRQTAPARAVAAVAPAREAARRRGPTEITEIIQSRQFLAPPRWAGHGWWEARLWQWFTPRERVLAEFAFPQAPDISKMWRKIGIILSVTVVAGLGAGRILPIFETTTLIGGIFLTTSFVLACVNYAGSAFRLGPDAGVKIPISAYYPVGLRELAGMIFKVGMVQTPLVLAWGAVCGMLIAHMSGVPLTLGWQAGIRGGCLVVASRFAFVVFGVSTGTNDTQRFGLWNLALLAVMIPAAILILACGGMGLFLPQQGIAWVMTGLGVVAAYGFFRMYAWFYDRNVFDLMNTPR